MSIVPAVRQSRTVPRLTLVVPCYDEEKRLDAEAFRRFRLEGVQFLFVNDGSRDGTLRLLRSLAASDPARFSVLDLVTNHGKAEAVRRGIVETLQQPSDLVGFWDADLATPLGELADFLTVFDTRPEIEMVFGARVRLLGRDIERKPLRHYVGRVGATLISATLGLPVYDTQCGAKLFRSSDALRQVFASPFQSRWIFDVEIIARFVQLWGAERVAKSIYELAVMHWHDVAGSKVKPADFARALADLWMIHREYNARR